MTPHQHTNAIELAKLAPQLLTSLLPPRKSQLYLPLKYKTIDTLVTTILSI